MSKTSIVFDYPYLLPIALILIGLAFIPHFKLNKHKRRNRNRISSIVLHCIIIFLITLVLSGFSFKVENAIRKSDIVFLVDVSDSNKDAKEEIDQYIKSQIKDLDKDSSVAFVTYGNGRIAASNFTNNVNKAYSNYLSKNINIDTTATNLENAIIYSKNILKNSSSKRIIIFTDGFETDGNALNYIKANKDPNLTIDAIVFNNNSIKKDIQINNVTFNDEVIINKAIPVFINLGSTYECKANISIYDNEKMLSKDYRTINEGVNNLKYYITINTYGMHDIHFVIEENEDTNIINNEYHYPINLLNDNKILIVDGTKKDSTKLARFLGGYYDVSVVNYDDVESYIDRIDNYGSIIMANVNNDTISNRFVDALSDYANSGGGVLFTGGDNTFHFGNFEGSKLEKMLPCWTDLEEDPSAAILIIIDKSSSMKEGITGSSKNKMELAKESAIEAITTLGYNDYAGIITFDASASVVVPITRASKQLEIINGINSIQVGFGTAFLQAFNDAGNQLISFNEVSNKHIIFISDGNPSDSGYQEKVKSLRDKGITVSTIGLGDNVNMDILNELAANGGGNCYKVSNASQLDDIMVEETDFSKSHYTNEYSSLIPTIITHNKVVEGISTLPALKGFYGVDIKPNATSILEFNNNSIYSTIEYGEGKIGCFTSDLNGNYSASYFTDSRGNQFILNAINDLYSFKKNTSDINFQVTSSNYKATITITPAENINSSSIDVKVTTPDSIEKNYKAYNNNNSFVLNENNFYYLPGMYKICFTLNDKEYEYCSTFSYSIEYDNLKNQEQAIKNLSDLCILTGGSICQKNDLLFNNEKLYYDYELDPRIVLLVIALCLFILDIAVRKFKFKWPHEIFMTKKQQ